MNRSGFLSRATKVGLFAFNVGEAFTGALLSSAASATTAKGDVRRHAKQDLTGLTYLGRSYVLGLWNAYFFMELGYMPALTCAYNTTVAYSLSPNPCGNEISIWIASGLMPNSNGIKEYVLYASYLTDAVVAVGVASSTSELRSTSVAEGNNYAFPQCTIGFQPMKFEVCVNLSDLTITVTPIASENVADIDPSGFLSWLATWQLSFVRQDHGKLYSSALGDAFHSSIGTLIASAAIPNSTPLPLSQATLLRLEYSFEAMIHNILTLYSSARVMVANQFIPVTAIVHTKACQLGEGYITTAMILNISLIIASVFEAMKTSGWKGFVDIVYTRTRDFVRGIARSVENGTGGSGADTRDSADHRDMARVAKPRREI